MFCLTFEFRRYRQPQNRPRPIEVIELEGEREDGYIVGQLILNLKRLCGPNPFSAHDDLPIKGLNLGEVQDLKAISLTTDVNLPIIGSRHTACEAYALGIQKFPAGGTLFKFEFGPFCGAKSFTTQHLADAIEDLLKTVARFVWLSSTIKKIEKAKEANGRHQNSATNRLLSEVLTSRDVASLIF
ncbi:MAG: hypothetical protein JW816_01795 [Candidatus Buchananbacteria bacterium]|nr:hypothetical protein [Candidatus Buchananbacteria bacterium]